MWAWWTALDSMHQIFYLIAIPFTVVLLLQTILLLFGLGNHDTDVDHDVDHDVGAGDGHDFSHDVDHGGDTHDGGAEHGMGLRMLTLRGIVAFMAVCGWVGVAMLDLGVGTGVSVAVAVLAGFAAMLLVALFMRMMMRLQQSGNLDIQNAVGLVGEVYIPMDATSKGKLSLIIQERLIEMDAVSTGEHLVTGQQARVIRVISDNLLVVEAENPKKEME